jgi:hypothetical protein
VNWTGQSRRRREKKNRKGEIEKREAIGRMKKTEREGIGAT